LFFAGELRTTVTQRKRQNQLTFLLRRVIIGTDHHREAYPVVKQITGIPPHRTYYTSAVCFFVVAFFSFGNGDNTTIFVFLPLGSTFLCIGTGCLNKNKEDEKDQEKKDSKQSTKSHISIQL
jgi:hypothetical protein